MTILWEPIQFLVELLLAEAVFTFWLERKNRFPLRLALCLAALFAAAVFWPAQWSGLIKMAKYLMLFLLTVLAIPVVFRCPFWEALYLASAAYAAQHIAYNVAGILPVLVWNGQAQLSSAILDISTLLLYLAVYGLIYCTFAQRIRKDGAAEVNNHFLTVFIVIMLVLVVVLNYCKMFFGVMDDTFTYVLTGLYSIIGCIFALFIQAGLYRQSQLAQKLEITEQLLHNKQEQYRVSEETIECINLKCHDLKHQISLLRHQVPDQSSKDALKEIEAAVLIYDSVVKTGNDALDVILTEKSLICEKNQIVLTCMVDGSGFAAFQTIDLYSIFGNILDNAIESVVPLSDPERRVIGLTVTNSGNMLLIHTENYFDHPITMENGLPVTTKEDVRFHGFGMKSVQLLVQRYGGTLSVETDDDIFNLNIMIPVSVS